MEFESAYSEKRRWESFVIISLLFLLMVVLLFVYGVMPKRERFVVELGKEVSTDLSDYLVGVDFAMSLSTLDLSGVNTDNPGTYKAKVTHFWRTFTYEIIIQDTTAPKIVLSDSHFYLEQGKNYDLEYFVSEVSDASDAVMLKILGETEAKNKYSICFDELGNNSFELTAEDIYGNATKRTVSVYIDTPPVIDGVKDCYVAVGTNPNLCNEIYVSDKASGDVTGNVVVDVKNLDCNKEGDYEIGYYVEDDFGLSAEAECVVHVMDDASIQKGIVSGDINPEEVCIVRANDDINVEKEVEMVVPSLVQIKIVAGTQYYVGSGFIVDITDEYVYVGTNRHVLNHEGSRELYFFDGTNVSFEIVDMDEDTDTGIVQVPIKDIAKETIQNLKPVNYSKKAWAQIDSGKVPLFFCLIGKEGLEYYRTGYDLGYRNNYKKVIVSMLRVSMRLDPGNSGSAIFDYDGNIIGIATGQSLYTNGDVHYYAVGAKYMVDLYERVTGNNLEIN